MRTFIAIPVSEEIKKYADAVSNELKQVSPDIKWVEYDNYHITLKFLGEIDENQIVKVSEKLDVIAEICPPFSLQLSNIGFFPNRTRPRVIWIGVTGEIPQARFLGERIDTYLEKFGFEPEKKRSFHITLGRIRSDRNQGDLLDKVANINRQFKEHELPVNSFHFMESHLSPDGPCYVINRSYKLSGS